MKIGLMTSQQFAVNTFNHLRKGYKDLELITITPEEAKKNSVSGYFDFKNLCKKTNISYNSLSTYSLKEEVDFIKIRNLNLDILCVIGWNRIIPKEILNLLKIGAIGSHSSPGILPLGRGRSPVVWGIKLGFSQIYNQLFRLTEGIDDGDILAINRINIDLSDDIDFVYKKIAFSQVCIIDSAIKNLINNKKIDIKGENLDLLLPKRTKENAKIDWHLSAYDIHNLIRAVSPTYHGAFFKYKEHTFEAFKSKIWDMQLDKKKECPGKILSVIGKTLIVQCGSGYLAILEHSLDIDEEILSKDSILY